MFVTAEDYNTRPYKLAGLDDANTLVEFNQFVDDWEAEWLPKILGRSFYEKFIEGVEDLPAEWVSTTNYIHGNDDDVLPSRVVRGVNIYDAVNDNADSEPSLSNPDWLLVEENNRWLKIIKGASYVFENGHSYYWTGLIKAEKFAIFSAWLKASVNTVSGVGGSVNPDVENSEVVSNAQDISTSWNKFARLIGGSTNKDRYDTLFGYLLATNLSSNIFDDTFDDSFTDFTQYLRCEFGFPGRLNQFNF